MGNVGCDLFQHGQPLRAQRRLKRGETSDVASRTGKALDITHSNWIANHHENDRKRWRFPMQRRHCRVGRSQNQIRMHADQFFRIGARKVGIAARPSIQDLDVSSRDPTKLLKSVLEQPYTPFGCWIVRIAAAKQNANPPRPARLLSARNDRPRSRGAAEQGVKLAAPQSITLSARKSIDVGNSMPIAFAVFKLTTMSNFGACSTGRRAGFAPLKIFPT